MGDVISVIIPVYNVEQFISQCVESVINQTYKNLEIIIIDDGSSDQSGEICDEYARTDIRISVIHQENKGLVAARKKGVQLSHGEYIGFVDSDDWIELNMYEELICKMKQTDADMVSCGRYIEDKDSTIALHDLIGQGEYCPVRDEYFCRHIIYGDDGELWGVTPNFWNKLFKRKQLIKFQDRLDDRITYGEDDACVYPYMAFSEKIAIIEQPLYHYRMRHTSMSHSSDERYFEKINLLYLCLKYAFMGHPLRDILIEELDLYMLEFSLRGLNWMWGINWGFGIPMETLDIRAAGLNAEDKIILYGAGRVGKDYYTQFCFLGISGNVTWVDKNYLYYVNSLGLPVTDAFKADYSSCDKIVIAVENEAVARSIKKDLSVLNVEGKPVIWQKPNRIFNQIKQMKKQSFSKQFTGMEV